MDPNEAGNAARGVELRVVIGDTPTWEAKGRPPVWGTVPWYSFGTGYSCHFGAKENTRQGLVP
jgi:hypothetical protein